MPDDRSNNVEHPTAELEPPFTRLLEFLSPEDSEEAGRLYLILHKKLTGFFKFKGTLDPDADAHETLERAGKRIMEGVDIPDLTKYCLGIARYIAMEDKRKVGRETTSLLEFARRQHDNDTDQLELITSLMKRCFDELAEDDRDLLNSYCQVSEGRARSEHRRQLAERLQASLSGLRVRVARLRRGLEDCVKKLSTNY
jgi:hypothetical protein